MIKEGYVKSYSAECSLLEELVSFSVEANVIAVETEPYAKLQEIFFLFCCSLYSHLRKKQPVVH